MLSFILLIPHVLSQISLDYKDDVLTVNGDGIIQTNPFEEAYQAINNLNEITTLKVSGSIYSIQNYVFSSGSDFSKLYSVKIIELENIETLSDNVFDSSFTNIESIIFGPKIRYIGLNFYGSKGLSINLPSTIERINPDLLYWIKSFNLEEGNKYYTVCDPSDTQYLLYANQSTIFGIAGTYDPIDLKIPDCITILDTINPFVTGNQNLIYKIKSIDLNNVNTIKMNAFLYCEIDSSITDYHLDLKNVQVIEKKALLDLNIGLITVQSSLEQIGGNAFCHTSEVEINQNTHFKLTTYSGLEFLTDINGKRLIYLNPSSVVEDEYSMEFPNDCILSECLFYEFMATFSSLTIDCTIIPNSCFYYSKITYLILGSSVRNLERSAFSNSKIKGGSSIPGTITSISNNAFFAAIVVNDNSEAWCEIEIGTNIIEDSAFSYCGGIKGVKINSQGTKLTEYCFRYCSNLEYIINKGTGYINYIDSSALAGCSKLKEITLDDRLTEVGYDCFSPSSEIYDENGFLFAGTKLVASSMKNHITEAEIVLQNVKYVFKNTFRTGSFGLLSLDFPEVTELEQDAFTRVTIKRLKFGPNLKIIPGNCFTYSTIDELIFETSSMNVSFLSFSSTNIKSITLPGQITFVGYNEIILINQTTQFVTINDEDYEFIKEESDGAFSHTLILSSPNYSNSIINVHANGNYKLHIKDSVRSIGRIFTSSSFTSVQIDNGLEALYSQFQSSEVISIPNSVNTIAYHGTQDGIIFESGTNFIWSDELLMDKDKKIVYGCTPTAQLTSIPNTVEILSAYSLLSNTETTFTVPSGVRIIEEYSLPSSLTSMVLHDNVEEIDTQSNFYYSLNIIPLAATKVYYGFLLYFGGTIEKGCKFAKLVNNVWYADVYNPWEYKVLRLAISIDDDEVDSIEFDCDIVNQNIFNKLKKDKLKTATFSARCNASEYFQVRFIGYEKLSGDIPELSYYADNSFFNTNINGSLNLYASPNVYINVGAQAIPTGVLHIYVYGKINHFVYQDHSPWIHVQGDLGYTPIDFGQQIVYDIESNQPNVTENYIKPNKISTGAIVGITIGVIAVILIICFLVFWFGIKNRKNKDNKENKSSSSTSSSKV